MLRYYDNINILMMAVLCFYIDVLAFTGG